MRIYKILTLPLFIIAFTTASSAADDLSSDDLHSPSPKDVLEQIEAIDAGRAPAPIKVSEGQVTLNFSPGETELSDDQKKDIISYISNPYRNGRIQIQSYASPVKDSKISARRLSLERALRVRELLKEQDISGRSVDIFPIGDNALEPSDAMHIRIIEE